MPFIKGHGVSEETRIKLRKASIGNDNIKHVNIIRMCVLCGKEFVAHNLCQKRCDKCKERACNYCGKIFKPIKIEGRYCSRSCASKDNLGGAAIKRFPGTFQERNRELLRNRSRIKYHTDAEYRHKVIIRAKAHRVSIKPKPCEMCGNPKADRHHDSYEKPLEIRWLCRSCHIKYHRDNLGSWGTGLRYVNK